MEKIKIIIKDYETSLNLNEFEVRKEIFEYSEEDTFYNLFDSLRIIDRFPRLTNAGPMYNIFDFIYTEEGVSWYLPVEETKIIDFITTYPNENLEINLSEVGMGAAGGFPFEAGKEILRIIFTDIFVPGIIQKVGSIGMDKVKKIIKRTDLISMQEILDYIDRLTEFNHPNIFFNAIYNRNAWHLEDMSEMFMMSKDFSIGLLKKMGYEELSRSDVFKLCDTKKDKFLQELEDVEKKVMSQIND